MAYLASNRGLLAIPADGAVEIRRDPSTKGVYLECVTCVDELSENTERSLFECMSCGNEVTRAEVDELAAEYVRALSSEFNISGEPEKKKRGVRWLFTTLFGSKKERRQLTS